MLKSPKKAKSNGVYLIELRKENKTDTLPSVMCDCGWKRGPSSDLYKLGVWAKNHSMENPGHILRHHKEK